MSGIHDSPWQTDTSVGNWYYNEGRIYYPASWVIRTLADVVSKNGNLMVNIVQRPDGCSTRKWNRYSTKWPPGSLSMARPSTAHGLGESTAKGPLGPRAVRLSRISPTRTKTSASLPRARRSTPSRWAGRVGHASDQVTGQVIAAGGRQGFRRPPARI